MSKSYASYRKSTSQVVDRVPTHWSEPHLSHLASGPITNGLGEAAADGDHDWPRYIRTTDISTLKKLHPAKRVTLAPSVANAAMMEAGDLLMTAAGSLGKSYLYDGSEQACFAGYLVRFRANKSAIIPRYAGWWTQSKHHLEQIRLGAVRSTIDNFSAGKFRSMIVLLPSLTEQIAIADHLDHETDQIDSMVGKQEQLVATLRERRAGSIGNYLDGLGGTLTTLKRAATIQTGVTLGADGASADPEWPYLRVANVQTGYVDISHVKTLRLRETQASRSKLRPGDVLMTEGGDIDKLGRGSYWHGQIDPCLHQNHVFAVRPTSHMDAHFLIYLLDAARARAYFRDTAKKTTNLASTNKWTLGNLPLCLPHLADQRKAVELLNKQTAKIDTLIGKAEQFVTLAKERRAALITAAVTGQIDVRDEVTK